jgi:serine protease SohB
VDFLFDLSLFGGKVFVIALAIGALLILLFALIIKARQSKPAINVENLNRKFDNLEQALKRNVLDAKLFKTEAKTRKKDQKRLRAEKSERPRLFVLDFDGDIRATHLENLREEVTAVLTIARPGIDEVLVRVESPGGMVHAYGLAATQLTRFKHAGVKLIISVDKVAASGGYMMACTADRILSAPFAILGSIGVVAQVPNFNRLLKKHDIDFEEITAGEFKRTISMFGEITEKGRRKFLDQIEDTHGLFKAFVKEHRPSLDLHQVATGEYWFGQRAKDLNLVDEIISSDDYLFGRREAQNIYKVTVNVHKKWSEKLAESVSHLGVRLVENAWFQSGSIANAPFSPFKR